MAEQFSPHLIVISGPNGAGKSTAAPDLLQSELAVSEFVNADVIARGLSAYEPERAAMAAGRIMLRRLHELADQRVSFAFETTLASKSFAAWIAGLKKAGYLFHLIYLWLPSPEMAIARVASRVRAKGHDIPDDVVRRRYTRGLQNFFRLYMPLSNSWAMYHNSEGSGPKLVAQSAAEMTERIVMPEIWQRIKDEANHAS